MKVCKFCGTENPDPATICPSCGGNEFMQKCGNCGNVFEGGNFCPQCGVKVGTIAKKCPNCGAEYYSAACPDCGYIKRAVDPVPAPAAFNMPPQPVQKKRTWLWVLGWIFIFPVPLTVLMVKNRKLNVWAKIGIIALAWILFIAIAFFGEDPAAQQEKAEGFYRQGAVLSAEGDPAPESSAAAQIAALTKGGAIEAFADPFAACAKRTDGFDACVKPPYTV